MAGEACSSLVTHHCFWEVNDGQSALRDLAAWPGER
jgi:hypothetical protein